MNRKRNVLIDCRNLSYPGTGLCAYCEGVISEFARFCDQFNFIFYVEDRKVVDKLGLPFTYSVMKSGCKKSNTFLRDFDEQIILPIRLLFKTVDVFHGFDFYVPLTIARYKKVVTIHDCAAFRDFVSGSLRTRYRKFLQHLSAKVADSIVTISLFSKREIVAVHGIPETKVTVAYNGIKKTFYEPVNENVKTYTQERISAIGRYILYYGGYRKNKTVEILLEAFEKTTGYSLILVGKQEIIRQLLAERSISDNRIVIWGFASDDEIKCLLDNCVSFVFPSSYEGFGLPVAEALSRGARVICHDIDVLREVGGADAWYFNSSEELVKLINCIEQKPKPSKHFYSYSKAVEQYVRIYNE